MTAYYNEFDPGAAAWLRELIRRGLIADGDVDERSIIDVRADDLRGYAQCHFFSGIGVWSYALRRAGWADDRTVWTGSPPCQPFSVAGRGAGTQDERHLWPVLFNLIRERRPVAFFGEQVEAAIRYGWVNLVQTDLEGCGYRVGAVGLPVAGFGGPHIRARLFFVADAGHKPTWRPTDAGQAEGGRAFGESAGCGDGYGMADTNSDRRDQAGSGEPPAGNDGPIGDGAAGQLGDALSPRLEGHSGHGHNSSESGRIGAQPGGHVAASGSAIPLAGSTGRPGPTNGFWAAPDWLYCRDAKWRPVEPGTSPLVNGPAKGLVRGSDSSEPVDANQSGEARKIRLKGYGNAICAEVATEFIKAYLSVTL